VDSFVVVIRITLFRDSDVISTVVGVSLKLARASGNYGTNQMHGQRTVKRIAGMTRWIIDLNDIR
jgi:hypothetical protein